MSKSKRMTRDELYRTLSAMDRDTSYLANVILVSQPNPARKLRGLYNLIKAGCEVRSGNMYDQIRIEGYIKTFSELDTHA
jgi:hypothetical protein